MSGSTTRTCLAAGVIVVITLLVYATVLGGDFIWDDDYYVTENDTLTSLEGLGRIWFELGATPQYYPLVHTTFWIEYHLWGLEAPGYHLVNVLLHAVVAVLLWRVLLQLGVPGAWWAALIFAVHPIEVESAAWITERKNVLSGVFYLAAALSYLRFHSLDRAGQHTAKRWRFYLAALAFFVFALLSKTVTCTLPAALLLMVCWKRGGISRSQVVSLIPMFVVGIGLGLVTVWMETHHVGARGEEWAMSALERCLLAGRILWFYAGKLLWPGELVFVYPRWQIDAGVWWQYLYPAAAVGVVMGLWLGRRRLGAGPLVAVLFFAGTLFPALGFFDVYPMRYSYVADHFQYLAGMGVIALYVAGVATLFQRLPALGGLSGPLTGVAAVLVLGVLTGVRGQAFVSGQSLWLDTLAKNPQAWMAHNNLGRILTARGRSDLAIPHYRAALRTRPDDVATRTNLALALMNVRAPNKAIRQYKRLIADHPTDPAGYTGLGVAMLAVGQTDQAVAHFSKAIELDPRDVAARSNLGAALIQQGQPEQAVIQLGEALAIDSANVGARCNLAFALTGLERLDQAVSHFRKALEYQPGDARILCPLGDLLRRQGKFEQAVERYRQVLSEAPEHTVARQGLAAALAQEPNQ